MPKQGQFDQRLDDGRAAELLRHAADVLIEVAVDGRILFMTRAVEPILGRSPDSYVGKSFLEPIVPEDRSQMLAAFQKVVTTGAETLMHFRVPRVDGLRIQFEATVRPFTTSEGETRIVAVARDVTQQTSERAIAARRDAYYKAIVESGGRPAAILDSGGQVLFSNRAFKATFGRNVSLEQILARVPLGARRDVETSWYESNRRDRPGVGASDFPYQHDDGSTSWFASTWESFRSVDGERHFAVLYEDISARKLVERALRSVAKGIASDGERTLHKNVELIAQALGFDRFVIGSIDPDDSEFMQIESGWDDGHAMERERFMLGALPESIVARGEPSLFPTGVSQLIPEIAERLRPDFESFAGVPLRRADGSIVGLVAGYGRTTITDTSLTRSLLSAFATHASAALDRQRANEEIRATRDRFDAFAHQSHEILIEIDQQGRVAYASEAALPILGYTPSQMIGKFIPHLVHPEDRAENRSAQATLFSEGGQTLVVNRIQHANGTWRWIESRSSSFTASDGSVRVLTLARDVTDRREAELGRDLLYRVVQEGADLVLVCELDLNLIFANEAAIRRLMPTQARSPGDRIDVSGWRLEEFLSEDDAHRLTHEILPELTPSSPWSGELLVSRPETPHPIPTEATIFLFVGTDDSGRTYLAVTLRDIEARRTVEEALRETEFRLNQAQKMEAVGRLAGGIAHDFNNLLTAIIGYSDLVLDELTEGHVARRDAEEILRAAERAGGLTRQLLAFSRRQVLQPEPVDLNGVVADIDRMMRRLVGESIELVTLQDGELRPIVADPGQIEQVIVNLVVNARDAMPNGGRLEIETSNEHVEFDRRTEAGILEAGHYAVLHVSDTGVGMDEETRSQIFEPFFTTKETHRGTGLGLASVYGIVSQSGGWIEVDSLVDQGTRFSIYFPVAATEIRQDPNAVASESSGGSETILLVEDAAPVRRLVQRTLEKGGYTVLAAESATAALRHCSRHQGPIDLILTDVVLPRTPGPEIAARARELRPEIRVLYMSGFTDETLARHGLDAARADLIEKPFTPAAMMDRVRAMLDREPAPEEPIEVPTVDD